MYKKIKSIHLVGIGGIGMSGIAQLLDRNGYHVSGSDVSNGESVRQLESLGIEVLRGHNAAHVHHAELVVHSSAVREDNPELVEARRKQIPVIPRAEMLAELMRLKYGIAVAGAHGKTTTTSMIGLILREGDLDPTIVVGGRMDNFGGTNARLGGGEFMVVEADESDGSFNKLSPSIAVATNLDREHMDFYETMPRLKKAFVSFLNKVPFYGLSVLCADDPHLRLMLSKISRRTRTYGFHQDSHYRVEHYRPTTRGSRCEIAIGNHSASLHLQVPGRHNVLNALAALCVADELSIPRDRALAALESFQGVQRRFQKRGDLNGVTLIDDYAHHPTEIRATLAAARERFPHARIWVVFQPHRYSRVEDLLFDFAGCFANCDDLTVIDIYSAGETPIPGIESNVIVESVLRGGKDRARHIPEALKAMEICLSEARPGDVILTLGAGDLPNVYKSLF